MYRVFLRQYTEYRQPRAPRAAGLPTSVAGAELSCTGCGDGDAAPGVLLPLCSAEPAREGVGVGAAVR